MNKGNTDCSPRFVKLIYTLKCQYFNVEFSVETLSGSSLRLYVCSDLTELNRMTFGKELLMTMFCLE